METSSDSPSPLLSNAEKIQEYQLALCGALSDSDWDYYSIDNYPILYKKIGFAIFGPPAQKNKCTNDFNCLKMDEADDYDEIIYTDEQKCRIDPVYEAIINYGAFDLVPGSIYMSVIFVFGEKLNKADDSAIFQVPVFRIRKCGPKIDEFEHFEALHSTTSYGFTFKINSENKNYCQIFIDDEARVYNNWDQYLNNNRLPKCRMHVPRNGVYQCRVLNEEEEIFEVMLDRFMSPACSTLSEVANAADIIGTIGGFGSLVVGASVAASSLAMAPAILTGATIVGIGTGVYAAGRSIYGLVDRGQHKQSVGLGDVESRNHYLNVAGGVMAGSAVGASQLIGMSVKRGATIGTAGRAAFNIVTGANLIVNGAGVINSLYLIKIKYDQGQEISKLDILQTSAAILFFSHAILNTKSANTVITEAQNNVLSAYEQNLSSNRKRKMFIKALKEGQRLKGEHVGKADMIRGLRVIPNHDDFFGVLVRNNKMLNKEGIRFTVGANGQIEFNNSLFIESSEFATMSMTTKQTTFTNLPKKPIISKLSKTTQTNSQNSFIHQETILDLAGMGVRLLPLLLNNNNVKDIFRRVLSYFELKIQEIIENILIQIHDMVKDLIKSITRVYPKTAPILVILQFLFEYIEKYIQSTENNNPNNIDLSRWKFNSETLLKITNIFISINNSSIFLQEIIVSFREWILVKIATFWDDYNEMKSTMNKSIEHKCSTCNGVYYTVE